MNNIIINNESLQAFLLNDKQDEDVAVRNIV